MLWFKNKNKKIKCSKYSFKASDFEITVLVNFIVDTVNDLKQKISDEDNSVLLADFIYKKYALMSLASNLGFSPFNEELVNRKPIEREIKAEFERRKKLNKSIELFVPEETQKRWEDACKILDESAEDFESTDAGDSTW